MFKKSHLSHQHGGIRAGLTLKHLALFVCLSVFAVIVTGCQFIGESKSSKRSMLALTLLNQPNVSGTLNGYQKSTMTVVDSMGATAATVTTDALGRFAMKLKPGTYTCSVSSSQPQVLVTGMGYVSLPFANCKFRLVVNSNGTAYSQGYDVLSNLFSTQASLGASGQEIMTLDKPAYRIINSTYSNAAYSTIFGATTLYSVNTYNSSGKLATAAMYSGTNASGTLLETTTYTYDASGNQATVKTVCPTEKSPYLVNTYQVNTTETTWSGTVITKTMYRGGDTSGSVYTKTVITLNANGDIVSEITNPYYGSGYSAWEYTYDSNRRMTSAMLYSGTSEAAKKPGYTYTYTYDANGNIASMTSVSSSGTTNYAFTLGSNGLLSKYTAGGTTYNLTYNAGNYLASWDSGGGAQMATYDDANRFLNLGPSSTPQFSVAYDSNGCANTIRIVSGTMTYIDASFTWEPAQ